MKLVHVLDHFQFFILFYFFHSPPIFLHHLSIEHERIMIAKEFLQIPNCNIAESIYNKWLQAFGHKVGNLYVAVVDDSIQAFFQVVAYQQFIKNGVGGDNPSKKLKLQCAQRRTQQTGETTVL